MRVGERFRTHVVELVTRGGLHGSGSRLSTIDNSNLFIDPAWSRSRSPSLTQSHWPRTGLPGVALHHPRATQITPFARRPRSESHTIFCLYIEPESRR